MDLFRRMFDISDGTTRELKGTGELEHGIPVERSNANRGEQPLGESSGEVDKTQTSPTVSEATIFEPAEKIISADEETISVEKAGRQERIKKFALSVFVPNGVREYLKYLGGKKNKDTSESDVMAKAADLAVSLAEAERQEEISKRQEKSSGGASSEKTKDGNEDSYGFKASEMLYVADGVTGENPGTGRIASQHVKEIIEKESIHWSKNTTVENAETELNNLFSTLKKSFKPESGLPIPGDTTLTLARVTESNGKKHVSVLHIGDTRLYIRNKDGSLREVTEDHGPLQSKRENFPMFGKITFQEVTLVRNLKDEEYQLLKQLVEECRFVKVNDPQTGETVLDVEQTRFRNLTVKIRAELSAQGLDFLKFFKRLKGHLNKSISASDKSQQEDIKAFSVELGTDDTDLIAVSDGITDVLTKDEFQKTINRAKEENPLQAHEQADEVIKVTKNRLKSINDEDGFAKNDDETIVIVQLDAEREIEAYEVLSNAQEIQNISDLRERLSLLSEYVFTVVPTDSGRVPVDGKRIIGRIDFFEKILDGDTNSEEFKKFADYMKQRNWLNLQREAQYQIMSSYLNHFIRSMPKQYGIRDIAARLFTEKAKEKLK